MATTPWLLFIDADILVNIGLCEWIDKNLKLDGFYITQSFGKKDISGTFFCPRRFFEEVGGYDEAILGWGGEDDDIYLRLIQAGHALRHYPDAFFSAIPHGDEDRFLFSQGNGHLAQTMLNHWYACMKYDLKAVWKRDLSIEERATLRQLASAAVKQSLASTTGGGASTDRPLRQSITDLTTASRLPP